MGQQRSGCLPRLSGESAGPRIFSAAPPNAINQDLVKRAKECPWPKAPDLLKAGGIPSFPAT
jgi:hypothetical protein